MAQVNIPKDHWIEIEYEVGDVVRLVSGDAPQRVLKIITRSGKQYLYCQYLSGDHYKNQWGQPYSNRARCADDFVLLQHASGAIHETQPKKEEPMTKLYQTKTEPVQYGTFLTKNSAGDLVLEMKGSPGDVKAFKEADVELVVPYTISVRPASSTRENSASRHYQVAKGSVEKGDLFLKAGIMLLVLDLDTKAHDAPVLKGARLIQTKALGEAADASENYPAADED